MPPPTKTSRSSNGSSRFYEIEGQRLPSVTTILQVIAKPALIQWAAKEERKLVSETAAALYEDIHGTPKMSPTAYLTTLEGRIGKTKANQRLLAKASEIGSQVHTLAEWSFRKGLGQVVGPEPKIEDRAQWAFMALQDWATSVKFKPIYIEQTVYSLRYGFAGTMDLLATVNGIDTVVDFKTGKAIYPEAYLQNAMYQVALEEMGHVKAGAGLVVRLPKVETDPEFETQAVPPVAELFPVCLSALELWKWQWKYEEAYQAKRAEARGKAEQVKA